MFAAHNAEDQSETVLLALFRGTRQSRSGRDAATAPARGAGSSWSARCSAYLGHGAARLLRRAPSARRARSEQRRAGLPAQRAAGCARRAARDVSALGRGGRALRRDRASRAGGCERARYPAQPAGGDRRVDRRRARPLVPAARSRGARRRARRRPAATSSGRDVEIEIRSTPERRPEDADVSDPVTPGEVEAIVFRAEEIAAAVSRLARGDRKRFRVATRLTAWSVEGCVVLDRRPGPGAAARPRRGNRFPRRFELRKRSPLQR